MNGGHITGVFWIGETNNIQGAINDVRIYKNEILSPREIKEISKGLVLHYPLSSGNMINKENVTHNYYLQSNGVAKSSSGWCYTDYIIVYSNSNYTCTGLSKGGSETYVVLYDKTKTMTRSLLITANQDLNITTSETEHYIRLSVREIQNELNTTANFLYLDNIEYDVSGYGNNGNVTNISYTSDAPRHNTSSKFNGSSSIIKSQSLPEETKTISIWLRTTWSTPSGYRLAVHDKKTGLAIGFSSNQLITYVGSGNGGSGSRVIYTDYYTANEWNHIAVVKTGDTTRDVYINGQFITPSSRNYWGGDLEELNIGARHINGSYTAFFNGELSDFRAYATALSADDILELYHTPASITNSGVLMTQGELSEV